MSSALSNATPAGETRGGMSLSVQKAGIAAIGLIMAIVLVGYIIIGIRSMQSEGVIDARLQARAVRVQTAINRIPAASSGAYLNQVHEAVIDTRGLLPIQFVQVDVLNTAATPPANHLVVNPVRHRAVLIDAAFLSQITHSGAPAATTIQSGTDSYRVYVAPLRPPARARHMVGVIEVFEKVDGTSPSM